MQDDLRSRSSYKLKEIQEKYNIISSPSNFVIDMGAAPGGWSIVASNCLNQKGLLIAIDLLPIAPILSDNTNIRILQGDMFSPDAESAIQYMACDHFSNLNTTKPPTLKATAAAAVNELNTSSITDTTKMSVPNTTSSSSEPKIYLADVILSDMMVNMCGNKQTDHFRSMDLCQAALRFTDNYLKPKGNFVCKYFRGRDEIELLAELKAKFQQVKVIKPEASRRESSEMYVVALRKK
jgi:21S rRNA (uridine2791-2'-O)-methyltransferase